MPDTATKDDLRDMRDTILGEMRGGFTGMFTRQDKTNGRLTEAEIAQARLDGRIKALEDAGRQQRELGRRAYDPEQVGERAAITRRDLIVFVSGVGMLWAILQGAAWIRAAVMVTTP